MTSTCNTCIHLHRTNNVTGQCRRHAPTRQEMHGQAIFPWVKALEDWCGEYSPNFHPHTEAELKAFSDCRCMPAMFSKPTPYPKDRTS